MLIAATGTMNTVISTARMQRAVCLLLTMLPRTEIKKVIIGFTKSRCWEEYLMIHKEYFNKKIFNVS